MVRSQCTIGLCRSLSGIQGAAGLSYHHQQHPARSAHPQPWYLSVWFTTTVGGILPFGACFVELFFILSSMWMDQYYYVFGFTGLVFIILVATCCEITIVLCYFQLCSENHRWWWRSFTSGSTAFYVFAYSVDYFRRLGADEWFTYVLYFGYMGLICWTVPAQQARAASWPASGSRRRSTRASRSTGGGWPYPFPLPNGFPVEAKPRPRSHSWPFARLNQSESSLRSWARRGKTRCGAVEAESSAAAASCTRLVISTQADDGCVAYDFSLPDSTALRMGFRFRRRPAQGSA